MAAPNLDEWLIVGQWPDIVYKVRLPPEIHRQPIHVLGSRGMGKSVLVGNCALQWNRMGEGVLLLDVKDGQLAHDVAARADWDKLVYVGFGECEFDGKLHHWGLNPLEVSERTRYALDTVVDNLISMFERMAMADFTQMVQLELYLRTAVMTALYEPNPTLVTVRQILTDADYRKHIRWKYRDVMNSELEANWKRFDDSNQMTGFFRASQVQSSLNRLIKLLAPTNLRMLLTSPTTLKLQEWLEEGKLVVVNCATGIPWGQRETYGNLMLAMAANMAFSRTWKPGMRYIRFVCDEFHKLAGNNFAELIELGRHTGCEVVMSHQTLGQLKLERGRNHTLFESASSVPVRFMLRTAKEDRKTIRSWTNEEQANSLGVLPRYTAMMDLDDGLPGLVDPGKPEPIELSDWWEKPVPGQLERAINAQRDLRFTTPESELRRRERMEDTHHEPTTPTPKPNRNRRRKEKEAEARPDSLQAGDIGQESPPVSDGAVRSGDPGVHSSAQAGDGMADREEVLSGNPQRRGKSSLPRGRKNRRT